MEVPTIPAELIQLVTLALSVSAVTGVLKMFATELGGKGAVIVSGIVALVLTAIGYGVGWVPWAAPACDLTADPFGCGQAWIATAATATALANALYVWVYERVFNPEQPAPAVTIEAPPA